jgi:hypothetical protein
MRDKVTALKYLGVIPVATLGSAPGFAAVTARSREIPLGHVLGNFLQYPRRCLKRKLPHYENWHD